jgi:hypothetical protein
VVQDVVAGGEVIVRIDPLRRPIKTISHAVENLGAGVDVPVRAVHAFDKEGWILGARVVNQATAASGIDDGNTCVVELAADGGAVASETFDSSTAFPAPNECHDLGTVVEAHVGAGTVLTLSVTNGAAADPGPFLVEVDYI